MPRTRCAAVSCNAVFNGVRPPHMAQAPPPAKRPRAGLPAPLPWRVARARAGMMKPPPDTRENFGDDRARRQGRARGRDAAGRGSARARPAARRMVVNS